MFSFLRNPLFLIDKIYQLTPGARQFSKDCALTQSKAVEVIKERRAALQDNVRIVTIADFKLILINIVDLFSEP